MDKDTVNNWIAEMQERKLARSNAACARALGISSQAMYRARQEGFTGHTSERTALACAALLLGIKPYPQPQYGGTAAASADDTPEGDADATETARPF